MKRHRKSRLSKPKDERKMCLEEEKKGTRRERTGEKKQARAGG